MQIFFFSCLTMTNTEHITILEYHYHTRTQFHTVLIFFSHFLQIAKSFVNEGSPLKTGAPFSSPEGSISAKLTKWLLRDHWILSVQKSPRGTILAPG